jgi:outer membrane protein, heavy metal efflux system
MTASCQAIAHPRSGLPAREVRRFAASIRALHAGVRSHARGAASADVVLLACGAQRKSAPRPRAATCIYRESRSLSGALGFVAKGRAMSLPGRLAFMSRRLSRERCGWSALTCALVTLAPLATSAQPLGDAGVVASSVGPVAAAAEPTRTTDQDARGGSLAELMRFARAHAPGLRVSQARRQLGTAAQMAAEPLFPDNPELSLSLGPHFVGSATPGVDASVALSQRIELAGLRGARLRAADRLSARLSADAGDVRFELELQLVATYRAAQIAHARVELAERATASASGALGIAQRRLDAGDATLIELRLAEAELAETRQEQSLATEASRVRRLKLCELSGWPADRLPLVAAGAVALEDAPALDSLLREPPRAHPELAARHAALLEARAELDVQERAAWPMPALGAQLIREDAPGEPVSVVVLGTVQLPLPLWQRNQGERARARAEQAIAHAEWSAAAQLRLARLRAGHLQLTAAGERLRALTASGASFESSLQLLERSLEAGELALLDVTVARARFLEHQRSVLSARADYEEAWIALEAAAGRLLRDELGEETSR